MLYAFVLLLLGGSQIKAYTFNNVTALGTLFGEVRLDGGTAVAAGTYDWIVSIHNLVTPGYVAPGVAYNANWVLTTQGAINPTYSAAAELKKLGVYVGLADAATVTSPIVKHRVKEYKTPATPLDRATIKHDLCALRVCPPLTTFAPMPTAAAADSTFGTAALYVNFATAKMERLGRKVGAACQCAAYTNYDTAYHFCLDEEASNFVTTSDGKAVVCIIGTKFAGFNVDVQNAGGEPYLDIFRYDTFLATLT